MINAININGISKRYKLGHRFMHGRSFREMVMDLPSTLKNRNSNNDYFWALKDITFSLKQGDALGIIGPNGAGKSTLLKILSKVTSPTKGTAEIYGRIGSLLEVGTGFHIELTGRENIFLNGAILGMKKREIERKFDEIVDFSEMEKFLDTPVKRYSSGMAVKLAFAVAAHLEPEILIVDEVLAVGDVNFQNKCLGKMKDVTGEGRTVILVSHNMQYIRNLCNHGVYIKNGMIENEGEVNDIIKSYLENSSLGEVRIKDLTGITRNKQFDGNIKFHEVNFDKSMYFPDDSIHIKLKLISHQNTYKNLSIGLEINDEYNTCIYNLNNSFAGHEIKEHFNDSEYVFSLDKLALKPGKYNLSMSLSDNDLLYDKLDNAVFFEVQEGNVYNFSNTASVTGKVQPDFGFIIK